MLGEQLWNYKTQGAILGIKAIKISNSGDKRLIAHSKSGDLFIFSSDGTLLFQDTITEDTSIWCSEFYDLTGNGKKEIILGSYDGLLRTFQFSDGNKLDPLWAHRFGGSISGILIEDINNDGKKELIVYSLDQSLRVLKATDGSLIWGQMFEEGIGDIVVWEGKTKTTQKEIYAAGNDHTIRAFKGNDGALLWFKRFTNKVRCVDYLRHKGSDYIFCGGDDKTLHILRRDTQEEIKTMSFDDYVWKVLSYPPQEHEHMIISSYSFAYFDDSVSIDEISFTSKMIEMNRALEIEWEVASKNVECIDYLELNSSSFLGAGTTKGKFLLIAPRTGNIELSMRKESCLNSFTLFPSDKTIFTAHDDGNIYAYNLEI
ncbi:MAG: WD40 repeat domain-containing protein [Promethearchaeia archaeon]